MRALITYTNDYTNKHTRIEEIKTLEDLINFKMKEGRSIIILSVDDWEKEHYPEADFVIEVYNDYRE